MKYARRTHKYDMTPTAILKAMLSRLSGPEVPSHCAGNGRSYAPAIRTSLREAPYGLIGRQHKCWPHTICACRFNASPTAFQHCRSSLHNEQINQTASDTRNTPGPQAAFSRHWPCVLTHMNNILAIQRLERQAEVYANKRKN